MTTIAIWSNWPSTPTDFGAALSGDTLVLIKDEKDLARAPVMDLGDAWEHSDNPLYPEKYASLAYRIAMNYFIYDLTH